MKNQCSNHPYIPSQWMKLYPGTVQMQKQTPQLSFSTKIFRTIFLVQDKELIVSLTKYSLSSAYFSLRHERKIDSNQNFGYHGILGKAPAFVHGPPHQHRSVVLQIHSIYTQIGHQRCHLSAKPKNCSEQCLSVLAWLMFDSSSVNTIDCRLSVNIGFSAIKSLSIDHPILF